MAFSIKAGLFPLFFWLPASYHTPPAVVGALFAGLLTKVGVYALIRIFTLLFQGAPPALFTLLLGMSAATMVIGLVAAQGERDFRRILSFNLVGHIGYTTASLSRVDDGGTGRGDLLRPAPYRRHHQSLPGQRRAAAATPHDRDQRTGRALSPATAVCDIGDGADFFAGRRATAVRFSRQARDPGGHFRRRRVLGWRHRAGGGIADAVVDGARVGGRILEARGGRGRHGHARRATIDRDCWSERRDAGDQLRRRAVVRSDIARGAAVAAPRRLHTGGAGRSVATCCSAASCWRLRGRRCRARSRSSTWWLATCSATSSSRCWPRAACCHRR